jgi:hydrogenase/urease accessory protein HupE
MKKLISKVILLLLISSASQAHTGELVINSWWNGLLHPLTGIDQTKFNHFLAQF